MAVTTEIPWGDGSGDKIYLTRNASEGDQNVQVSSDANTGAARSKVVTFTSGVGNIQRQLTINQAAAAISPVFYDYLVFDGTAYIITPLWAVSNPSFKAEFGSESQKKAQRLFMARPTNVGAILSSSTTSTNRAFAFYNSASSAANASLKLAFSTDRFTLWMTPKRVGVNNLSGTMSNRNFTLSSGIYIGYTPSISGQPYTGKMGTFRIYGSDAQDVTSADGFDSYTPLYTLRPCTYNGEAGLWCVETSQFLGNSAASGTLIATN